MPDVVDPRHHERYGRLAGRLVGALGVFAALDRVRPTFACKAGLNLLVRWSGEKRPVGSVDLEDGRPVQVVGAALASETTIAPFATVTHAASTVYWHALVTLSGGGELAGVQARQCVPVQTSGAGAVQSVLPNAVRELAARRLSDGRVQLSWIYSGDQASVDPDGFEVFAAAEGVAFNWATPLATVTWRRYTQRYAYTTTTLNAGDAYFFAVRTVAGPMLSLVPRAGIDPSPVIDDAAVGRALLVRVPQTPQTPPAVLPVEVV